MQSPSYVMFFHVCNFSHFQLNYVEDVTDTVAQILMFIDIY